MPFPWKQKEPRVRMGPLPPNTSKFYNCVGFYPLAKPEASSKRLHLYRNPESFTEGECIIERG